MSSALAFLRDELVPCIVFDEDKAIATVTNRDRLALHVSNQVMIESITTVFEATTVWSAARVEEATDELKEWAQRVHMCATAQDSGWSILIHECINELPTGDTMVISEEELFTSLPRIFMDLRNGVTKATQKLIGNEPDVVLVMKPFSDLGAKVRDSMPDVSDFVGDACDLI